jgi:NAD(P)-dependent dehydrogenase (short-subunit alcohol dehydrogenase family)
MARLADKVALVTGAGSGIGRATAALLSHEGATVFALDLFPNEPDFDDETIVPMLLDVADEDGWSTVVERIRADRGRIDVLVNNAGIGGSQLPLVQETLAGWAKTIDVNQTGVFLGMRAVLPTMIQQQSGSIVNISSAWGIVANPGAVSYQSSKGAVRHMTKNAAVTYSRDGVRVNSVHPGMVATPAVAGDGSEAFSVLIDRTPIGRIAQPMEIAYGVLYLASDESSYVTGSELVIDGGYTAV